MLKTNEIEKKLEDDCQERIEEGLAAIAIGIIYPPDLRKNWDIIEEALQRSSLSVRVFSENGRGEWFDSDLNGLSEVLRNTYESLVNEDVLNAAVNELRQSIETASLELDWLELVRLGTMGGNLEK